MWTFYIACRGGLEPHERRTERPKGVWRFFREVWHVLCCNELMGGLKFYEVKFYPHVTTTSFTSLPLYVTTLVNLIKFSSSHVTVAFTSVLSCGVPSAHSISWVSE